MKTEIRSLFTVLSLSFIFHSCAEDQFVEDIQPREPEKFPLVEDDLKPYFQRFEDEALKLGIEVDLTAANISGRIAEIDEEHVAGQCFYNNRHQHSITVDQTFWNSSSDLFKEFIVFHELGHCYLGRDHLETAFNNGICKSIMRSGTGFCFDYYRRDTRDYYMNELFFPEEGAPAISL